VKYQVERTIEISTCRFADRQGLQHLRTFYNGERQRQHPRTSAKAVITIGASAAGWLAAWRPRGEAGRRNF